MDNIFELHLWANYCAYNTRLIEMNFLVESAVSELNEMNIVACAGDSWENVGWWWKRVKVFEYQMFMWRITENIDVGD